jgi:hypothetical protein
VTARFLNIVIFSFFIQGLTGCVLVEMLKKHDSPNKPHEKVEYLKYSQKDKNQKSKVNGKYYKARDKSYKEGVNYEYYKNGKVKSESTYKRKITRWYTETYWTIREFDMEGRPIRLIKKITQIARKENVETIIKEEIYNLDPNKPEK